MNTHQGAYWTSGTRTQVAKRKKARYIEALTQAAIAAFRNVGKSVSLDDYLTWPQIRILTAEAEKHGMGPGAYLIQIVREGAKAYRAERSA